MPPIFGRAARLTSIAMSAACFAGCTATLSDGARPGISASLAVLSRSTSPQATSTPSTEIQPERAQGYRYIAAPIRMAADGQNARQIELSFNRAPVAEVALQLLGEAYGGTVSVSPEIAGTVTLETGRAVPVSDLPSILANALALQDIAVQEVAPRTFQIVPQSQSNVAAPRPRLVSQGTPAPNEVTIYPLRHRSANELTQALQPFTRNGAQIITLDQPPTVLISGSPSQRHAVAEMIDLFDVDWLAGTSISLIPLQRTNADAIAAELSRLVADHRQAGSLDIIALPRLNAIVAFARDATDLQLVEDWVVRLDVQPANARTFSVHSLTNSEASEVADHLNSLFGPGEGISQGLAAEVRADESSNRVLVAAAPELQEQISALIEELDQAPDQVLIEAMIVEVVLTDDLAYGVQWFLDTRDGGTATSTANRTGGVSPTFPGFSYTYSSDFVRAALNAISSLTQVETLSSPQIVVRNNASASVQVGDQVPIVTQTAVSVSDPDAPIVNSVQFRDTGVNLTVTARIDPDGLINLDVAQEVSSVAQTTTSGIDSPTIQQRRLESNVSIYDGESVVLGGLIRTQSNSSQSGIPGLQSLPGFGGLFSDTARGSRRTELLVFLTPRLIRSRQDAVNVTDELRSRMQSLRLSTTNAD